MDKNSSRKAAHNARVRKKLLKSAAPLFRDRGPDNVGIDEVMGRAGMTRGAFYAHFKSKEDVFHAALHQETPLLASLERRVSQDQAGLLAEMRGVFETYLKPDADQATARSCTPAGLAMDVARGPDEARRMGFVQEIVPQGQAEARAMDLARTIARQAPLAVQATMENARTMVLEGQGAAVAQFHEIAPRLAASEDFQEGVQSFRERRDGEFKGR